MKCLDFGFEKCNLFSTLDVSAIVLSISASILAESTDWHLEILALNQNMKKEQLIKVRDSKDIQGLVKQETYFKINIELNWVSVEGTELSGNMLSLSKSH